MVLLQIYKSTYSTSIGSLSERGIQRLGSWEKFIKQLEMMILDPREMEHQFNIQEKYKPFFAMIIVPGGESKSLAGWRGMYRSACVFQAYVYVFYTCYLFTQKYNMITGETTNSRIEFELILQSIKFPRTEPRAVRPDTIIATYPYHLIDLPCTYASWPINFNPTEFDGHCRIREE